ncbi:hypothetical protein YPPY46_2260 [Yersinia pestis PY-46]|nr:hypothetical protein YPPY07_2171 [Yersinia pestis PY-07]EIS05126.1 hypothetical protein YPPY46_2260 [Yersinia pestis PY-46]EIS05500.1 hypothetical protein YPPY47_2363 [Yersinia pestis PY-47]EIS18619.1 hypothetical protein YPPY52_2319 [Yersinia pestis PY-52]EIS29708.1 hypothetical protein YPPY55_2260 [Yersinia pestis PY-55]EIS32479.1 hypothetical protein YPPY56_2324 [Yersinia pestis PY-56]EIS45581.1 hypothetical protein YPPY59_2328 [Yersinia pestis PY-59]EIS67540.1 hypothetical protein YPP
MQPLSSNGKIRTSGRPIKGLKLFQCHILVLVCSIFVN